MERIGAQGVSFFVTIILARILEPSAFGTIALVMVFISILEVFVDSGLGTALVQKKDADELDFTTVLCFNIFACLLVYCLLFFLAPAIASFYNLPDMIPLIRVLSITVIISGAKNVLWAYVSRNLLFKKFFFSTLCGTIGAAILGIWMAYRGYGVWALVAQSLLNNFIDTVFLWVSVGWKPIKSFSLSRLKGLFSYGSKLLISGLLDTGYKQLRSLIIGKIYTTEDLAFYNRGEHIPGLLVGNIDTSLDSVLLPVMSKEQDNIDRIKSMMRRSMKTSIYIVAPLMIGTASIADRLIRVLLTEKWMPAVFFLRVFCLCYVFYPVHTTNLNAIKAIGRSDYFLKLEIFKKVVGLISLAVTMNISVEAMAYSALFMCFINQIINSWPNKKFLGYSYAEQIKDIMPYLLLASFMGIAVYFIGKNGFDDIVSLLIQIVCGIFIYIFGSKFFRFDSFEYLLTMVTNKKQKKREEMNRVNYRIVLNSLIYVVTSPHSCYP